MTPITGCILPFPWSKQALWCPLPLSFWHLNGTEKALGDKASAGLQQGCGCQTLHDIWGAPTMVQSQGWSHCTSPAPKPFVHGVVHFGEVVTHSREMASFFLDFPSWKPLPLKCKWKTSPLCATEGRSEFTHGGCPVSASVVSKPNAIKTFESHVILQQKHLGNYRENELLKMLAGAWLWCNLLLSLELLKPAKFRCFFPSPKSCSQDLFS